MDAGDIEEEEVADVRVSGYVPTASTPDSFAEWVAPHLSVLTAVAIREVGRNDADDVVQDAVTRAWQRRASYRPERGTARVWLLTLVMDQARRRRVHTARHAVADPTATPPDLTGPDDAADHHAQRLDVERAVASLPRRQREVVTLYYLAGLSAGEVGAVLKISVGTVKSQLSDARATLRLTLERS